MPGMMIEGCLAVLSSAPVLVIPVMDVAGCVCGFNQCVLYVCVCMVDCHRAFLPLAFASVCHCLSCVACPPNAPAPCLHQILNKRKGFVRIALQTGAKLVPVIGFGENDLFDVKEPGPVRRSLMKLTKSLFGFTLPNPVGMGLFWGEQGKGSLCGGVIVVLGYEAASWQTSAQLWQHCWNISSAAYDEGPVARSGTVANCPSGAWAVHLPCCCRRSWLSRCTACSHVACRHALMH